ncbi:hypothetical protein B0H34DRAFT_263015 [Crassisporium funariophilum]|nr:hypothetical protein B0H34DRAFT_263015 [Crassisporium funariophilum]
MEVPRLVAQTDFPCTFQCTSGELLFGQIQCIIEGMKNNSHDGMSGPTSRGAGGTILQNDFKYRVAARVGRWEVSRIYLDKQDDSGNNNDGSKHWHIAYVLHHEDVSPVEFVRRASRVGISNNNKHSDKDIVYVNRYDWSWHHGQRTAINVALGPGRPYTVPQVSELMAGRLIVLDASRTQTFIDTIKESYPERQCYTLLAVPGQAPYGVHLDSAGNRPEYELGWLGFSGKRHELFPESDELVAIVYDPAYTGFSPDYVDSTRAIMVEQTMVTTGDEATTTEDAKDTDDEDYVPEDGDSDESTEGSESSRASSPDILDEDELASLRLPDILPPPGITGVVAILGLNVNVSGSTLGQVTSVFFGDLNASFKVKSNTLIEASAPAGISGPVDVKGHRTWWDEQHIFIHTSPCCDDNRSQS